MTSKSNKSKVIEDRHLERMRRSFELRAEGKTYEEIASVLGVTSTYVPMLITKFERQLNRLKAHPPQENSLIHFNLTSRARNILNAHDINTIDDLTKLVRELGWEHLQTLQGMKVLLATEVREACGSSVSLLLQRSEKSN